MMWLVIFYFPFKHGGRHANGYFETNKFNLIEMTHHYFKQLLKLRDAYFLELTRTAAMDVCRNFELEAIP
jgi:hypothetical protein